MTNFKRVARSDAITRIPLLALQMPGKDTPLLPLAIDDISDFKKSPLWELFAPSSPSPTPNDHDRMNGNVHESQNEDADGVGEENVLDANQVSEIASSFLGPGPWKFQKDFQLPRSCDQLHFTNKNKKSNIIVSHLLKIIFRVQRGDDDDLDPTSGKRKLYDIVVQTPIHILSVSDACSSAVLLPLIE